MIRAKNSYVIIQKDFKGLTAVYVTDDATLAVNRPNVCRNWNSLCDSIEGKLKDCIVFYNGKYDKEKDKITLYKKGYIVDEFHEVLNNAN